MSSTDGAVRYLEIRPNNVPADGKISHKGGIPVINFTIGSQNAILKTDSIRLAGRLHIWRDALGTLVPTAGLAADLMASEKLGVYGTMSQLVWRSAKTKQVCESVSSESALIMPSYSQFQDTIIRNTEVGTEFCCPLLSGMTMGGENLNLMDSAFGGLEGEIHLCPDSQFFYSQLGGIQNIGECFYQFQDLRILCEVYVPPPDELSRLMSEKKGVFNFNSISSYMSTIQSSNSIVNFHLGLSRVISAFLTFTPSAFINNKAQNGYLTYLPTKNDDSLANIDSVSYLKGGERFPYHFVVDTNVRSQPDCAVVDPQIVRYFANSIVPEEHQKRCSISPVNTNRGYTSAVASYSLIPEGGANYGVGVLYDMLNSDGVNFKTEAFTLQMNSGLTDGNPISAFLFVKHKTTLAWNEEGIEVVN